MPELRQGPHLGPILQTLRGPSTMTEADFHLTLAAMGAVKVSDRGQPSSDETYPNAALLVEAEHQVELELRFGEDGPFLEMMTYHAVNPETGHGYHASIEIPLDRQSAQRLRTAVSFLVDLL
jgi:hypothetical protein